MRDDYLIFGEVNSQDYHVGIYGNQLFNAPEREYEKITIPGRDGELLIDQNRYKNKTVPYDAYIVKNFASNIEGFISAMVSQHGYQRLEDTIRPDEYRLAKINPFEVDVKGVLKGGVFTMEFDCKPQHFLKSGEVEITLTADGTILNATQFDAKPLLRIYGSGEGTVGIGSETITISTIDEYVDIDCEIMDAYKGSTNCNSNVSFTDNIVLSAGSNGITITGDISSVAITPRWYIL